MIYHRREEWERAGQEINAPLPKGTPGYWVIHYPGSPASSATPMTDGEMVRYLQATQSSYLNSRGYSLGYSAVVSQSSSAWEVRGIEGLGGTVYNPASNPGRKLGEGNQNHVTRSIQIAVSGQDRATPAAVATVNEIIATQPNWPVRWHGQIDWTSCAGEGIIAQIQSGEIGHQQDEDNMRTLNKPYRALDTRSGGPLAAGQVFTLRAPNGANDIVANVSVVVSDGGPGYLVAWGAGNAPDTSTVNWDGPGVTFNLTRIKTTDGYFRFRPTGPCHLIVDVQAQAN